MKPNLEHTNHFRLLFGIPDLHVGHGYLKSNRHQWIKNKFGNDRLVIFINKSIRDTRKKMAHPQKKIDLIILQKTRRIRIQFLYCPQLDTSWDVTKSGRTISFVYFENNWEVLRVDECISTRYDSSNIYESGILDNVVSYKCMKKIKNRFRPTAVSFKFDFEIYVDVEFLSHGACWNSLFWFKMWKP